MVAEVLGADEVRVEAKGLTGAAIEAVRKVEGVLEVEQVSEGLVVKVKHQSEVRPAVARIIIGSGADLLTIREGDRMLEKAYIEALKSGVG